jgi:AcrR family transcriptional regulator
MSTSTTQTSASKRPYQLRERAAKQEKTRRRIVDAAVELHSTLGPARTSVAQIAERAGVQRHTYYAHFRDDRSLFAACSGLAMERDPLPVIDAWNTRPLGIKRIRYGLAEIYAWFERNECMTAAVLRDAEYHPLTRDTVELSMKPWFDRAADSLGEGLPKASRDLLVVALDFHCWRALRSSRTSTEAAALMSQAVVRMPDLRATASSP